MRSVFRRATGETGLANTELAFVLGIFFVLLTVVMPLVRAGWEYHVLTRATSHAVRYATRADTNARESSVGLTRRPTAEEVAEFTKDAASPLDPSTITVTVDPEPAGALPGEQITVMSTYQVQFGPAVDVANAVTQLFFGGALLPESTSVTVSAWGREE